MSLLKYAGEHIQWIAHAIGYIDRRGFSIAEVEEAIRRSDWTLNERGKLEATSDFPFESTRNGKNYDTKQIRAVFVKEGDTIVVITVYTYFF
jgi:hypothetical protein